MFERLVVLTVLGASAASASAAEKLLEVCREVEGTFETQFEVGPGCVDSPIQMCTHGVLVGDLEGTYEFSFLSSVPDPEDPTRSLYTGASVITLDTGEVILGSDTGVLVTDPDSGTMFTTNVSVIEGTNFYAEASGQLVALGDLDVVTGFAAGTYAGEVCVVCSTKDEDKSDRKLCKRWALPEPAREIVLDKVTPASRR